MTKEQWPTVKLGDLYRKTRSTDPRKNPDHEYKLFSIPAYDSAKPERVQGRDVGSTKTILESGDVLLSKIVPHIQRVWVIAEAQNAIGSSEWIVLNDNRFDPDYLRHYLFSKEFHKRFLLTVAGVGGSLSRARPSAAARIEIPLPPLEEQRRIAEMLDATSRMIETTKTVEDNLENFAKAAYSEFFSGFESPEVLLTEVGKSKDAIKCGPFGTQLKQADFQTQGVPLIGIKSVNSRFELSPWEFLAREKAEQLASYDVRPGDILMTRKGTIGNCSLYPRSLPHGIMHSDLLRIRVDNPHINPVFLLHQLHYDHCIQSQIRKLSPGAVMPGINVGKLKKLKIRVPPIEIQERFAKVIQASDQTRAIVRAKLKALIELQSSLSARAFSAEL